MIAEQVDVAIEDVTDLVATHGPFLLTKTSVLVTGPATYEEWEAATIWVQDVEGSATIWLGELIEYGESRYGEKYSQALETSGYAEQTLKNATYFVRNVSPEVRRDPKVVPVSVQMLVAPLPVDEQVKWLDKCESESLTREQLQMQIKSAKAVATGQALELWLLVKCSDPTDQTALAEKLRGEGRSVKLTSKEG